MSHQIQLSDHFNYGKLLRFTAPSMVMMFFSSIYSVVDGVFVSNFVGKTPFAAINLIMPLLMFLSIVGFIFGSGGSALIAKTIGENDNEKANRIFTMLVVVGALSGIVLGGIGGILVRPIAVILGASGKLLNDSVIYGQVVLFALPFVTLQNMFQSLFVTAERPKIGLAVTVISGLLNILLDVIFINICDWGLVGAAFATVISQAVGGLIPLVYFMTPNTSLLQIVKPVFDFKALGQTVLNGMSEFFSNVSMAFVSALYNFQLMKYIGEDGVAAYGVLMYITFIFFTLFIGFSMGSAPIVSYNYGAKNDAELKNVFLKSVNIIALISIILVVATQFLAKPLALLFASHDQIMQELTIKAFRIYSISFLLAGFNGYASAFFTALNNGVVSTILATGRTLVFETFAVMVLPLIFGLDGIWMSALLAEIMALVLTLVFVVKLRKRYRYY
ncbi:MAG: MATE family efflux transporter [Bacteroidales bacterium]|nr:MATE family efflux transporter [Bacteroidales bacterium]